MKIVRLFCVVCILLGLLLLIYSLMTTDKSLVIVMGALGGSATAVLIDTFNKRIETQISNEKWRIKYES